MVEQQPTLSRLNRHRARPDFYPLPAAHRSHHESVHSPKREIRAQAAEDVAERRMSFVTRTAQHCVHSTDLAREEHSVSIARKKRVLQLVILSEVTGVCDADRRAVKPVAPRDVVPAFQQRDPRIVPQRTPAGAVRSNQLDRLFVDLPRDPVCALAEVKRHVPCLVVAAEHADKSILEGNHGAVEYTVRTGDGVPRDDRIFAGAPYNLSAALWLFLPGYVRQCRSDNSPCLNQSCCLPSCLHRSRAPFVRSHTSRRNRANGSSSPELRKQLHEFY